MTTDDTFGQHLTAWLHEEAGHRVPDHLGEVLVQTAATRQRPWWSSPERWLPMQTTLRLAPVPRVAWLVVLVALIAVLGLAVLFAGAQPRLPAPFGLARNGPVAYGAADGDIYAVDSQTGVSSPLVTGAQRDVAPFYSRDGARFAFLRGADDHLLTAFIARADARTSTPSRLFSRSGWWDWSYDGTRLANPLDGGRGPGDRPSPTSMAVGHERWMSGCPRTTSRGGDQTDRELVFRGYPPNTSSAGIFAVRPDGTGMRQVSPDLGNEVGGYQDPQTSEDGTRVAYTVFEPDPASGTNLLRLHVLDLTSGRDIVIPGAPDPIDPTLPTDAEGYGVFSADGRQIAFWRDSSDHRIVLAVAPSDGSWMDTPSARRTWQIDGGTSFDFSPDASTLVVRYPKETVVRLIPLDGRPGTTLPLDGIDSRAGSAARPDRIVWTRLGRAMTGKSQPLPTEPTREPPSPAPRRYNRDMAHRITLIPGDGIGPEVADGDHARARRDRHRVRVGAPRRRRGRDRDSTARRCPDAVLDSIRAHKVALKGPVTTPVGDGFTLRQRRPAQDARPLRQRAPGPHRCRASKTRYDDVDLVIVRENTEDLYSRHRARWSSPAWSRASRSSPRAASTRIARFAFDYARTNGRKQGHRRPQGQHHEAVDGLFLDCCRDVAATTSIPTSSTTR